MTKAEQDNVASMEPSVRNIRILEIDALESLTPTEEGVELNEGYNFNVNGSIPQLADAIAKLINALDQHEDMGENAGGAFLALILQYYENVKTENN